MTQLPHDSNQNKKSLHKTKEVFIYIYISFLLIIYSGSQLFITVRVCVYVCVSVCVCVYVCVQGGGQFYVTTMFIIFIFQMNEFSSNFEYHEYTVFAYILRFKYSTNSSLLITFLGYTVNSLTKLVLFVHYNLLLVETEQSCAIRQIFYSYVFKLY